MGGERLEMKYLNMSLGDIPEEHEENGTSYDQNPSSFDKILNYNSNTSSKIDENRSNFSNIHSSAQDILKIKKDRSRGSGDSRFSTYMNTEN